YRESYSAGRQMLPDVNKEISNILKKLHELFSRYEKQKEETDIQVAYAYRDSQSPPERLYRAGGRIRTGTIASYLEGDFRCKR
ncbi:MAG: hypothetical protein V3U02_07610, partial [Calditrichia bacterium]